MTRSGYRRNPPGCPNGCRCDWSYEPDACVSGWLREPVEGCPIPGHVPDEFTTKERNRMCEIDPWEVP